MLARRWKYSQKRTKHNKNGRTKTQTFFQNIIDAMTVGFRGTNGKYEYKQCDELFSFNCKGKVKPELVDSVSIEVNKILHEEKLLF
jgi:hypothetical protein